MLFTEKKYHREVLQINVNGERDGFHFSRLSTAVLSQTFPRGTISSTLTNYLFVSRAL